MSPYLTILIDVSLVGSISRSSDEQGMSMRENGFVDGCTYNPEFGAILFTLSDSYLTYRPKCMHVCMYSQNQDDPVRICRYIPTYLPMYILTTCHASKKPTRFRKNSLDFCRIQSFPGPFSA